MRKTKIICTLGPASSDEKIMEAMLLSGLAVARLNFSHGSHAAHKEMIDRFRRVRDRLGLPAAIMLDTRGPEIRLGTFENGSVMLEAGKEIILTAEEVAGTCEKATVSIDLSEQLAVGDTLLIDDGRIRLTVSAVDNASKSICAAIHNSGEIADHKGINIPGKHIDMPYLSEKDMADLLFGIENDVDFVAASFVRSKEDVIALRKFLDYHGGHDIQIISKIENLEGIENFDEILAHSNGIMVARGDMGVEVEYERLPGLQKKFIRRCYQSGKMVITATQMLDSMINSPSPTRAEITDVANAVFDGTSAVMLSGESAMGSYPVEAVRVMARIAEQAEKDAFSMDVYREIQYDMDEGDTTNAICDATCTTARDLHAKAILALTKYGYTARRMSKFRPYEPIVAATPTRKTFHQLSLSWGVYPVFSQYQHDTDKLFVHAIDCARQIDLVEPGDFVVISAGSPLGTDTNTLKVQQVPMERV